MSKDVGREAAEAAWERLEAAPETETLPGAGGLTLARMRREPVPFFEQVLGWSPWWKQAEIAGAVAEALGGDVHRRGAAGDAEDTEGKAVRRIAVRSGNGAGKTAIAARIMLWVLRCWPESIVITTAPTSRQVEELLWREARRAYHAARLPLGGRFYDGRTRWDLDEARYAIGMSPDNTRAEHSQGFHGNKVLFIVDEASGVPAAHWEAIKGNVIGGKAAVLALGNPSQLHGEFYDAFHSRRHLWRGLHISAFDTPNLGGRGPTTETQRHGGEGDAFSKTSTGTSSLLLPDSLAGHIPGLVTREAVEELRADWGEDSSLWQVRVLGEFPSVASRGLIDLRWLEAAASVPEAPGGYALGVDVARAGEDETALVLLRGNTLVSIESWRGQDTMRTVARVVERWKELGGTAEGLSIAIDDGGVGGGVVDRLRELDVPARAVNFGAAAAGRMQDRFKNKGSEMYWLAREALREKRLHLPGETHQERRLHAQLLQVQWEVQSDGRIWVHKRGLDGHAESPDLADGLALAVETRLAPRRVQVFL